MTPSDLSQLVVMAKYWAAGRVKTRLGRDIGMDQAAAYYRRCLKVVLESAEGVADRSSIAISPWDRRDEFRELCGPSWRFHDQGCGDLGNRMEFCLQRALQEGIRRVILIGSDAPTLPREYLTQAFRYLREHSLVLGPAEDGGYYLVGCRDEVPPIFSQISWGTPYVWEQTMQVVERQSLRWKSLPSWYDVDTAAELPRLRQDLQQLDQPNAASRQLLHWIDKLSLP